MLEERSPSVHPVFLKQAYILLPAPSFPSSVWKAHNHLEGFFQSKLHVPDFPLFY